ncbi:TPA: phage tail protein [Streptococcus pyogenes]|uniref:phage tail protein n=1 Tax=Streptococcus pyogenes TaxID=1314 RepID=UPI000640A88F|nr:phage tail protein [Streptococcus pyogenes]HER4535387.1 phage tail protein [Streptococcus pyogenes NGAS757]HER4586745.1 phage tail protein [Streptococcus pyogenes NGAS615]HER4595236.1 phage tail protein [Streptococcus pyogenes NGAS613]HER4602093.1 phage tail protein [Streptococcus pyogenes NGAS608]HER4605245.1 phage tail protein [Streptococcus pyogenes NGAS609]HER4608663.1 phage tail protein [Streptococcus pyogenes NGAS601]HER4613865.1 phage tail protein [Streptococcus pyogenes NGAS596]H
MITFLDHRDIEYGVISVIRHTNAVNGERSVSGEIYTNSDVLNNIDRGWRLRFEDEYYVVIYAKPVDVGQKTQVSFDAIHQFFWDFSKSSIYEGLGDGSHTIDTYLETVFKGSGYRYKLEVGVNAFRKQSFNYKSRLDLFNEIIKATGLEFSVSGKVVRLLKNIGTDLSTVVRKNFNMNDLTIEKNIDSFITYQKGFGAWTDPEDHSKGRLEAEYESPLAKEYGRLEGAPLTDERFTVADNLKEALKSNVENSYKISVKIDMEDLTRAGYRCERPVAGDYIMAINETLGFQERIRIVSFTSYYDATGALVKHEVTCNDIGSVKKQSVGSLSINSRINQIDADIASAIEVATQALVSADGKNTVYGGTEMPKDEPKGTLKKGDILFLKVGDTTRMYFWNGAEWEEPEVVNDPERWREDLEKQISEAIEKAKKAQEEINQRTDKELEEFRAALKNLALPEEAIKKITEAIKVDDIPSIKQSFDDLKNRVSETSEESRLTAEILGNNGKTRYNKNLLVGDPNRVKTYDQDYIEVEANDGGFKRGETYTISFSQTCELLKEVAITLTQINNKGVKLVLTPTKAKMDAQTFEVTKDKQSIEVYPLSYTGVLTGDWYKPKQIDLNASDTQELALEMDYKDVVDGKDATITGAWSDSPQIILYGGKK